MERKETIFLILMVVIAVGGWCSLLYLGTGILKTTVIMMLVAFILPFVYLRIYKRFEK